MLSRYVYIPHKFQVMTVPEREGLQIGLMEPERPARPVTGNSRFPACCRTQRGSLLQFMRVLWRLHSGLSELQPRERLKGLVIFMTGSCKMPRPDVTVSFTMLNTCSHRA